LIELVTSRFKGTRELSDSDKYRISKEGDTYVLTINGVFGEDADEYCVKATTKAGSRSSRADLVIKSKRLVYNTHAFIPNMDLNYFMI